MSSFHTTTEVTREFEALAAGAPDADRFRALLDGSTTGLKVFLCRLLAASDNLTLKLLAVPLALEAGPELQFECQAIIDRLSPADMNTLVEILFQSHSEAIVQAGIEAALRNRLLNLFDRLVRRWPFCSPALRPLLAETLFALDAEEAETEISYFLKQENEPTVIAALLELALHFQSARKPRLFEQWLRHPGEEVRLAAAKGLSLYARPEQAEMLLDAIQKEKNPRILGMLFKALLRRPNKKLANRLFEMAAESEDAQLRNQAVLHFRQLPDPLVYEICQFPLEWKDDASQLFAIQELSFLEFDDVPQKLIDLAAAEDLPLPLRSTAIQGLVNHGNTRTRNFLYQLFLENQYDPLLTILIIHTLARIWGPEDQEQMRSVLERKEGRYAGEIRTTLSRIERLLSSKRMAFDPTLLPVLYRRLESSRTDLCALSLRILRLAPEPLELGRLLPLLRRAQDDQLEEALAQILVQRIPENLEAFFIWLDDDQREEAEIDRALDICETSSPSPGIEAELFWRFVAWEPGWASSSHAPRLERILARILGKAKTRELVKSRLETATTEQRTAFLERAAILPPVPVHDIAHEFLVREVSQLSGPELKHAVAALSRFGTAPARQALVRLYLEREDLRPVIAASRFPGEEHGR